MDLQGTAQLLGNFGEFLGFAAVLATLVYLSMQTRQTRIASERGMTAMVTEAHARWRSALYQNPDLARLVAKANAKEPLEESEEIQIKYLNFELFVACMLGFYSADPDSPRAEVEYLSDIMADNPCVVDSWQRWREKMSLTSPELAKLVDQRLSDNNVAGAKH
jgi:hypothetical protein